MTTRKTSTSKSQTKSSKNSGGKSVTRSTGTSKKTAQSSSAKSKTQNNLKQNLNKLTSVTPRKTSSKQKENGSELVYRASRKSELFPHYNTFPWRLDDRKENKTCWFQCEEHVLKYIQRYNLVHPKDYMCLTYSSKS